MYVGGQSPSPPALASSAASAPTAYAAQPAFQLPPAYAASAGAYQPGYGAQAGYQSAPAVASPPYLASQTADRSQRPIDPYRDSLRLVLFVFGILLIGAFCTPLSGAPSFHWNTILDAAQMEAKLPALFLAVVGVMAIVLASLPLPSAVRGILSALFAAAALLTPLLSVGFPPWRPALTLFAPLLLLPGLLLRQEYRAQLLPRLLVTVGALAILAAVAIPEQGQVPLLGLVDRVIDLPGTAKVQPILGLLLLLFVLLSLLAWLPAPSSGGAKLLAWLLIFFPAALHFQGLILGESLVDAIKAAPYQAAMGWAPEVAYPAVLAYGLSAALGKIFEPS